MAVNNRQEFNLIDESWIPCKWRGDRGSNKISISFLFENAGSIAAIVHQSPLVTGAVHRLLIAILHRALEGPKDKREWLRLYKGDGNDGFHGDHLATIKSYLAKWHDRFYLIHPMFPFYQVHDLNTSGRNLTSFMKLCAEVPSGNTKVVFRKVLDKEPPAVPFEDVPGYLLAHQCFSLGGTRTPYASTRFTDKDRNAKYSTNAPLARAALLLFYGESVQKTLALNSVRYDRASAQPFCFAGRDDLPAWEREIPAERVTRLPNGLVDWLTWQQRALKLVPDLDRGTVSHAVDMRGEEMPNDVHRKTYEPMVVFKEKQKPGKNEDPFPAVEFSPERAIWRDSTVIYHMQAVTANQCLSTREWLSGISELDDETFPLMGFGLISDRAKKLSWQQESFPFPIGALNDKTFLARIDDLTSASEHAGASLNHALFNMITDLEVKRGPDRTRKLKKDDYEAIRIKVAALNVETQYWHDTGLQFWHQITGAAVGHQTIDVPRWKDAVKERSIACFDKYFRSLHPDSKSLKAYAEARSGLKWAFT